MSIGKSVGGTTTPASYKQNHCGEKMILKSAGYITGRSLYKNLELKAMVEYIMFQDAPVENEVHWAGGYTCRESWTDDLIDKVRHKCKTKKEREIYLSRCFFGLHVFRYPDATIEYAREVMDKNIAILRYVNAYYGLGEIVVEDMLNDSNMDEGDDELVLKFVELPNIWIANSLYVYASLLLARLGLIVSPPDDWRKDPSVWLKEICKKAKEEDEEEYSQSDLYYCRHLATFLPILMEEGDLLVKLHPPVEIWQNTDCGIEDLTRHTTSSRGVPHWADISKSVKRLGDKRGVDWEELRRS